MNTGHLIDMANQIGEFFASMPDRDEALAGIADHIRRFWEPRMRRALLAAFDDPAGDAAQRAAPIVREAIAAYRDTLTPAAAPV
ncbi:formate dehydrogenase [Burkholderia ubonensis]|uniref:Formate dehydrogenase n=1 Tax=Burkholderia ubonensis TaxID=101571 RepID=A0A105XNF8_9BURK|nr:formate dehydrogenase subunit delta [Burkholderia ubonensis]AJX16551.1 NADH-dependent formate dehydrogenase delta subunit FdsD family protein [Burkholderia ubonensis MSMB22]KVA73613.1 formate dehydrogenase [Burkholderia ubonensis]KVC92812.1 formate dehydrogenase [Burkholderia ubonensis]KVD00719.1 formate dehydrogenase [Burkholderia ubonensis]KVD54224.1 formate dehydrogenase [Burkholderia ubonensis]